MKKTVLTIVVLSILLGTFGLGLAQVNTAKAAKPLAVVSFSGYDRWFNDVGFVGKISNNEHLAHGLEAILKLMTKNRGLVGLDKTRPFGAVVTMDGKKPAVCAFVPVADLKKLMSVVGPLVGEAKDVGDGVFELEWKAKHGLIRAKKKFYIKQKGDWAFIVLKKDNLKNTPADPLSLIKGLNKEYDLAVKFNVANFPRPMRDQLIAKMESDVKKKEKDNKCPIRKAVSKEILDAMTKAVDQLDEITLGWTLDHKTENVNLDLIVTALPGTNAETVLAAVKEGKTKFGGFQLPGATLAGGCAYSVNFDSMSQVSALLDLIRENAFANIERKETSANKIKAAKLLVGNSLDLIGDSLADGKIDRRVAVVLAPKSATVVAATHVANGQAVENLLRQLSDIACEEHPGLLKCITKDADEYKGVRFHSMSIPIPDDADNRDKVVALIGNNLDIVFGIADKEVYFAAGRDAMKTLKKAIAKSTDTQLSAMGTQWSLALQPLASFIAVAGEEKDRPNALKIVSALKDSKGCDHINFTVSSVERGVRVRLQLEADILQAIGTISTQPETE